MTSVERHKAFKKWQWDLEERLAWFLFNLKEDALMIVPEQKENPYAILPPESNRDSIGL